MIQITLTTALALYSGVLLCGAIIIWLYTELHTRHKFWVLEKQHVWRCVFCGYTYLDEDDQPISECPRCQSLNAETDQHAKLVPNRKTAAQNVAKSETEEQSRRNPARRKNPGAKRRGPRRRR